MKSPRWPRRCTAPAARAFPPLAAAPRGRGPTRWKPFARPVVPPVGTEPPATPSNSRRPPPPPEGKWAGEWVAGRTDGPPVGRWGAEYRAARGLGQLQGPPEFT